MPFKNKFMRNEYNKKWKLKNPEKYKEYYINYCKCGQLKSKYAKTCQKCYFESKKGKCFITEEGKKSLSESRKAENNPMWKGDNVGYASIHEWIKNRIPKPQLCQCCQTNIPYDLANISGLYKRDLSDWEWLCRSCHMHKDGRMNNLNKKGRSGYKKGNNGKMILKTKDEKVF
jgi:hypothetical protein